MEQDEIAALKAVLKELVAMVDKLDTTEKEVDTPLQRVKAELEKRQKKIDWSLSDNIKHCLYYDHKRGEYAIGEAMSIQLLGGLYSTKKACKWVRKHMRDDLDSIYGISTTDV